MSVVDTVRAANGINMFLSGCIRMYHRLSFQPVC